MKTLMKKKELVAGIVLGICIGVFTGPIVALSDFGNDNHNEWRDEFFGPLLEAVHQVQNNYVEKISPEQLLEGAFTGIMNELDDS